MIGLMHATLLHFWDGSWLDSCDGGMLTERRPVSMQEGDLLVGTLHSEQINRVALTQLKYKLEHILVSFAVRHRGLWVLESWLASSIFAKP